MAVPKELIEASRTITPNQIVSGHYGLAVFEDTGSIVLSAARLRGAVNRVCGTALNWDNGMNWENWLDVRSDWLKQHNATLIYLCESGDPADSVAKLLLACQQATREGSKYFMVEPV